ncbi:MAG: iron-sulfur cluster assembly scaffold protein [Acidobacteriota bacterium]|nr:iron-sulfur cluster assembly scaffold protein [Acidobacteriota bacterium]
MQLYSGPAAEVFLNPQNVGDAAEPNFIGRSASLKCGAALRVSLQIDESQRITEAKFRAAGCSVLVASASLLIDQIVGMTTAEAAALGQNAGSIIQQLGTIEAGRIFCPALAREALVAAIQEYSGAARDEWEGDEALICTCFGVSEKVIEREVRARSLVSIEDVTRVCNAGAGCRSCYPLIQDILDDYERENSMAV